MITSLKMHWVQCSIKFAVFKIQDRVDSVPISFIVSSVSDPATTRCLKAAWSMTTTPWPGPRNTPRPWTPAMAGRKFTNLLRSFSSSPSSPDTFARFLSWLMARSATPPPSCSWSRGTTPTEESSPSVLGPALLDTSSRASQGILRLYIRRSPLMIKNFVIRVCPKNVT